jgi:Kef-type K+ transport system membrane component KefB
MNSMVLNANPIFTVLIIATVSSILAELPLRYRVPTVVWKLIFGIMIGQTTSPTVFRPDGRRGCIPDRYRTG